MNEQAPTVFVALADATTLLASPGKDYVVDAMRKVELQGGAGPQEQGDAGASWSG